MKWKLLSVAVFALVASVLVGCGGTRTRTVTVRSAPSPALLPKPGAVSSPGALAPSCTRARIARVEAGHGYLGVCAPKPGAFGLAPPARVSRGQTGPDLSNNDPIGSMAWRLVRRHGHAFVYLKVVQGIGFIDRTAAGMAAAARRAGVVPGGYDFLEVCRVSPEGEAALFARELRADGLLGSHSFVPMGDAEWPLNAPCSTSGARAWLVRWQAKLHALIHVWAGFYTGAWWWDPNVGCFRMPHEALRWVSGYIARHLLPIPCRWSGVDLWQFADDAFNGVSRADMSVLEASASRFTGGSGPSPAQRRAAKLASLRSHERERRRLHEDIDRHHCRKGQHATPREPLKARTRYHDVLCPRWIKRGRSVTGTAERLRRELHAGPLPVLR